MICINLLLNKWSKNYFVYTMIKDKEQNVPNAYQCKECGLWYKDREIRKKCQAWCKEHKSCNLEIIKHSIKNMTNNNSQKGFAMPMVIAIIAVVLVLGGVAYYANRSQVENAKMVEEKAMMEKKAMAEKEAMAQKEKEAMMNKKDETMMKKDNEAMMAKYTGIVLAGKSAPLLDFTKADYDMAIKSDKLVVLYFYANWCQICKAETANALYPEFNKLTSDKVVGFRVNYNDSDTDSNEKALASQFGVAYQHTKVFVKNGQRILKSPEGWDQSRYDTEINKALIQ